MGLLGRAHLVDREPNPIPIPNPNPNPIPNPEHMGNCTRISSMVSSMSDSRTPRPEPLSAASSAGCGRVRLMSLDALTAISTAALKLILGPLGVRVASWLGLGLG